MTKPTFSLGARIGSGAYGSVFYARWGGDPCAAKTFFLTESDYHQDEIQNEIRILQRLRHRNIIQFYRTHEHEGCTYLIMDLAENGSLAGAIGRISFDWPAKTRLAHEIARGLEYIHLQKIWHRDLKSANVLLSRHMEAKLCDFGLAEVRSISASRSSLTVKGTLRWMAPELLAAKPMYSAKSDIYALGMVMWEMAAGCTRPFRDQDSNQVIAMLVKRGEREELPVDTPADYHRWVERCWDHDPEIRPEASEIILVEGDLTSKTIDEENNLASNSYMYLNASKRRGSLEERIRDMSISSVSSMSIGSKTSIYNYDGLSIVSSPLGLVPEGDWPEEGDTGLTEDMDTLIKRANGNNIEAQVALAAKYEAGEGTIKNESEAFYWYLRAAKQGHVQSQYHLGDLYFHGRGTPQSGSEAASWYRRAAEQGYDVAQLRLGWMLANGRGVEQSDDEAAIWCLKAAEQDNISAQMSVGWMHLKGKGVYKSEAEGARWFRRAAEQGNATAQNLLGTLYFKGRGVPQDDSKAVSWYRKAAEQGDAVAQNNLGWMSENGRGIRKDEKVAFAWYQKAAEQGEAVAQNSIGWMHENGRGVEQSDVQAVFWYRKAAEQGNPLAQTNLGSMYKSGRGIEQSDEAAVEWYRKAAEAGDAAAQRSLGSMYIKGRGVEKSDVKAAIWFCKAAEQGDVAAQYSLGSMYSYGRGVAQSDADAAWWYRKAADQGDARAQFRLGSMYEVGRGVYKSDVEAIWWYRKAAEQDEPGAQYSLGTMYEEGRHNIRINLQKAFEYYRKAALHNHAGAIERVQSLSQSQ